MCWTAAITWAYKDFASLSGSFPSFDILVNNSPPPAYSITIWSLAKVSTTSYRRITFGWWSLSILDISRDNNLCVFWSSFVLSRIFMATFSEKEMFIMNHTRKINQNKFFLLCIQRFRKCSLFYWCWPESVDNFRLQDGCQSEIYFKMSSTVVTHKNCYIQNFKI